MSSFQEVNGMTFVSAEELYIAVVHMLLTLDEAREIYLSQFPVVPPPESK